MDKLNNAYIEIENNLYYDVPRYIGRLKISKDGQLYSMISNKILKPHKMPNGYIAYSIMMNNPRKTKTEYLHRLLAETFIPNPDNKATVNHIDGNKENNSLDNLEWCTQSENNLHAIKNNLRIPNTSGFEKYNNEKRVLTDEEVEFIKEHKSLSTKELSMILCNDNLYAIYDWKCGKSFKKFNKMNRE